MYAYTCSGKPPHMDKKSRLGVGRQNSKSKKRSLRHKLVPVKLGLVGSVGTDADEAVVSTRLGRRPELLALVLWADRGHGVV